MELRYLLVPVLAWVVAQSLKHFFRALGRNRRVFHGNPRAVLLLSGGMPSAHSAAVVSMMATIGLLEGIDSAIFALSALFAAVVAYDSVMVRYSSGVQGDTLNSLIKKQKANIKPIPVAHGHTVPEAIAGALVGLVVSLVVINATI